MTRLPTNRPDAAIVAGFGDTRCIDDLQSSLHAKTDIQSSEVIMNVPLSEAHKHPDEFIVRLCEILRSTDQKVLIGHSYGALLALAAACRLEFRNVSNLFLIDGPLRSDVEVPPIRAFKAFSIHYEHRKTVARRCEAIIASIDHPRIVAMGSQIDWVVPGGAKFLKGNQFAWIELSDNNTTIPFEPSQSYNICYPLSYSGHQLSEKRVDLITNVTSLALASSTQVSISQPV